MRSLILVLCPLVIFLAGCRAELDEPDYGGFPREVGEVLVQNCATSGCHDDASYLAEGRLSLSGWNQMFQGSRAGAAVIPYDAAQSFLLYFINTDTNLGISQVPTMPLNMPPLSKDQYLLIKNWIEAGAPSADGKIMWSDNSSRGKIYVVNQGCDQVAVLDRETRLVMRYVSVGSDPGLPESPHNIKVSPDGKYWYLVFITANPYFERYDAATDLPAGRANIGVGSWNTLEITPDGQYAMLPNLSNGTAVCVDLATMTPAAQYNLGGSPHGVRFHPQGGAVYFTQQEGDVLTKLVYTDLLNPDRIETVDLIQGIPKSNPSRALGPHEMLFSPDGQVYAVTCSYNDEIRFFQASNDSLLAVLPVGNYPVEMDATSSHLFVTCMEDTTLNPGNPIRRGSVDVVRWSDYALETRVYTGFQPHGISVDEPKGLVYVAHRNVSADGPAPHHSSNCGGRNGNITAIRLGSFDLLPNFKHELSADPYSVGLRR